MDDEQHPKGPEPGVPEQRSHPEDSASAQRNATDGSGSPPVESTARENPEGHVGQHRHIRIMPAAGSVPPSPNGPEQGRPETSGSPSEPPAQAPRPSKARPDLRREELVKGSHPGDRYIKVGRTV